ncbi:hypothetical protein [Celerinatantimonas sp. YJH-8]|uniref:hypothetical protein n=1 Tax=Celerinatantimonas sp. YJH-8 TaxID=3228714 RepID=UPI0038C33BAA
MKKLLIAGLWMSTMTLSGCATLDKITAPLAYTSGKEVKAEQLNKFKPGVTKKSEVVAVIGEPSKKEMLGNTEIWRYHYVFVPPLPGQKNINEDTVFEWSASSKLLKAYKTESADSIL